MMAVSRPPGSERGVALVLVLVILPLAAIIMTQLHFETTIGDRLATNVLANQQFKQAIAARRRQMQLRLVRDLIDDEKEAQQGGAFDHYADDWGPETEGGMTSIMVTKGDKERGDEITLYTEVVDEQSKFNLNMLLHNEPKRRARTREVLKNLLDLFRDSKFDDLADNEYDLDGQEAEEVATAVVKFLRGEERDERVPSSDLPPPNAEMKQGLLSVEDLIFAHPLILEKRLLERFTDVGSNQVLPSLTEFLTVHGDGKINANTARIQLLRAMFRDTEGQDGVAEEILTGRGGFLPTEEGAEDRQNKDEERGRLQEEGNEDDLAELDAGYKTVNHLNQLQGLKDPPFLRSNEIDIGRDFTVRSNFFTITITAQRGKFLRQHRVIVERHQKGTITWESEVRHADASDLPRGAIRSPDEPDE